jgi:hypothetical protein
LFPFWTDEAPSKAPITENPYPRSQQEIPGLKGLELISVATPGGPEQEKADKDAKNEKVGWIFHFMQKKVI